MSHLQDVRLQRVNESSTEGSEQFCSEMKELSPLVPKLFFPLGAVFYEMKKKNNVQSKFLPLTFEFNKKGDKSSP